MEHHSEIISMYSQRFSDCIVWQCVKLITNFSEIHIPVETIFPLNNFHNTLVI